MSAAEAPPRPEQAPVGSATSNGDLHGARPVPPGGGFVAAKRTKRRPSVPAPRASRVVVKKLDPWSVLKVSLLFYLSMFLILLVAMVLLWAAATSIGVVGNIEGFMDSIGFTDFTFEAAQLLRASALGGAILVLAGTFGNVVMAVLYNLISEVVGGLKITLGEDEASRRAI